MKLHAKAIKTKVTPTGECVIAFSVCESEYRMFLENHDPSRKYYFDIHEYFNGNTFNQRGYFYSHLRELAKKWHWNFDETKHYIMTEDGIEVTEHVDGEERQKIWWVDKSEVPNVESYIRKIARKTHIYLRQDFENENQYGFRMFKGVSLLDSQEMAVVIDRLIDCCNNAGITTISPEEYRRIRGE